ncbi:hypothetical protein [Nitrosopumilus sp. Nsub]|uniref:hypothetical protein n=1 Tax=Nitrosopumilus sp. Nsub TaxID=1776294 RepID=UPI00155E3989|nr:hypothetical protein [Nitrosopumilus sp. Nsub]
MNENALNREIDFTDGRDVIEQDIGGRGNISSGGESSFESYPEIARYFLNNVNLAKEYLEEILGIEESEDDEDEDDEDEDDEDDEDEDDEDDEDEDEDDEDEE